jgi:hypothetical protein
VHAGLSNAVGSSLTLTGAIAVGWGLHRIVVLGDLAPTAPAAVAALAGGAAVAALGWRLESRPATDGEDDAETEATYDERFSPVDEGALGGRDRDDDS